MRRSPLLIAVVFGASALIGSLAPGARAQDSGSTLSPDLQSFMVNKDLGNERWTINLNLFSTNPDSIINITGNIFRTEGGPPSFVACMVREDSTGTLRNLASTFRLSCMGTDACESTAELCARDEWRPIDDDVAVPASFFLPPGGLAGSRGVAQRERIESFLGDLVERLSTALAALKNGLPGSPRSAHAQSSVRGTTLTFDRMNHLVTKDVGAERWSISYNLWPVVSAQGGVVRRFLSVTGNVFQADGSPPSFVYCTQNPDSEGTLEDPSSIFSFACVGTDACETSATACAATEWRPINDDVRLEASFFLPPLGLPASPQSDPEILVIGRTSDPPSIVAPEFTTEAEAGAADRPAGGCPDGATCFVPSLGTCEDVAGTVVLFEDFGCGCLVEDVPPECIACDGDASGQCGGDCEYGVGEATARGTCLPFDSMVDGCICYAIGNGEPQSVQGCGGSVDVPCPGDRCCANDPRGSCEPLGGQISCPGVCVGADGCDPEVQQCGICLSPPGVPTPTPTGQATPTPTPSPDATPTAQPTATPTPSPTQIPTPTPTPGCIPVTKECEFAAGPPCCNNLICQQIQDDPPVCLPPPTPTPSPTPVFTP